jgi:activator of HSP90 ATPase
MFLSPKYHGEIIGGKAKISKIVGDRYSIWNGSLKGKNLMLRRDKMIVQSWRGSDWKKKDDDSILIIHFEKIPGGTELHMVHTYVPAYCSKDIDQGWRDYYWKPWKKYIRELKKKKR